MAQLQNKQNKHLKVNKSLRTNYYLCPGKKWNFSLYR